jgi:hypothetical protein
MIASINYLRTKYKRSVKMNLKTMFFWMVLVLSGMTIQAQTKVLDYKTKTSTNASERTVMLDLLRVEMKKNYALDFKYVVNHFKVSGNFAWLQATAQRKDGKPLELSDSEDCCHVECLYQKTNGKWKVYEYGAFSTDVWWEGIQERSGAAEAIFE